MLKPAHLCDTVDCPNTSAIWSKNNRRAKNGFGMRFGQYIFCYDCAKAQPTYEQALAKSKDKSTNNREKLIVKNMRNHKC